jgi:D-alanine transfer protein
MKKIKAFLLAFLIFTVLIGVFHVAFAREPVKSDGIGSWVDIYKDGSYSTVSGNFKEDTTLVMGSSEFQHGRNTPYHPTKIFRKSRTDVMLVGAAYNQSILHAITEASLADNLNGKKVVLILSPAWFNREGIKKGAFDTRFSETMYIEMLKSDAISDDLKRKIAERTEELLSESTLIDDVERYNKKYLDSRLNLYDRLYLGIRETWLKERDKLNMNVGWKTRGESKYLEDIKGADGEKPDFTSLEEEARSHYDKIRGDNPYGMSQRLYKRNFQNIEKKVRGSQKDRRFYPSSPEYSDLDLFLQVADQAGARVELILLPINGKWYDHMGFTEEKREALPGQIEDVCSPYKNVKLVSFYGEAYTDGFLEDATHPSGEGWVKINEEIYKFICS